MRNSSHCNVPIILSEFRCLNNAILSPFYWTRPALLNLNFFSNVGLWLPLWAFSFPLSEKRESCVDLNYQFMSLGGHHPRCAFEGELTGVWPPSFHIGSSFLRIQPPSSFNRRLQPLMAAFIPSPPIYLSTEPTLSRCVAAIPSLGSNL